MSYIVTKYPQGTFCWADLASNNISASKSFLTGLFGWVATDIPTGPESPVYTMFAKDGHTVAGAGPIPRNMPSQHSQWNNYVSVDNIEEILEKVTENRGSVEMPAMDVMDAGRMAAIKDPTGAELRLWQPKETIGAQLVNTVGAMCWNELYTPDVEKAKEFYTAIFGWKYEKQHGGENYWMIKNGSRLNGGIMQITPKMQGMPPKWMTYFTVAHLDESMKKLKELGGMVYKEMNISVGKIAIIADPAQAGFMILEFAGKPEEWVE